MAPGYGVDLHPVYQAGYTFANPRPEYFWLKVSDGSRPYTKAMPDVLAARGRSAGIPGGGYHWAQPVSRTGGVGPAAQADVLLHECDRLKLDGLVPMLDLEDDVKQYVWPAAEARDFIQRFVDRCATFGRRRGVYMNGPMAKKLGRAFTDRLVADGTVIWFARYGNKPEAPGSAQYLGHYDVHQYDSAGGLDKNQAYTSGHLSTGGGATPGGPSTMEVPEMTRYECRAAKGSNPDPALNDPGYVQVEPGGRSDSFVRILPGDLWIVDVPEEKDEQGNIIVAEEGHFETQPVWVEHFLNYGINGEGLGGDPGEQGAVRKVANKVETFPMPNVARCGVQYSSNAPFVIIAG